LVSDVISLLQSPEVEIVLPAPVWILSLHDEGIEGVEHGQVISILVYKLPLRTIAFDLLVFWSMENSWNTDQRNNRKNFIHAVVSLGSRYDHL